MFTKSDTIINNRTYDILRYIDGLDITNSAFFRELPKINPIGSTLVKYKRYDLLAEEIYKDVRYSWLIMIYNGINEKDLNEESYINYPSLDDVNRLILRLEDEYSH